MRTGPWSGHGRHDDAAPDPEAIMMSSLREWNARQLHVLERYCRLVRVPLTPDVLSRLASRYAAKHAGERPLAASTIRRRRRAALALVVASVLVVTPFVHGLGAQRPAPRDTRPTVAVLSFSNGSIFQHDTFDPLSTGITELLIHELSQNGAIRVVEREQLQKVMAELGLSASDRVDQATAARVGRLVGAQHVVVGGFVVDLRGRVMAITARADETETGVVASSQKVEGKPDDALKLIATLGQQLSTRMHLPPMPDRSPAPGRDGGDGRFDAVLLYSRALVEQDRGNRLQAAALLNQALARYPAYPAARAALVKLARMEGAE